MSTAELNPFLLAAVTPEPDPRLLPLLRSKPSLASAQDSHGYSLLHAASSYNHVSLLRALVLELKADVNLLDEDGETCLFVAESVEVAKCLVEELKIDTALKNVDSLTARERIEADGEWPEVINYLQEHERSRIGLTGGATIMTENTTTSGDAEFNYPPPLPPNMRLDINTMTEESMNGEQLQEPDPEFKRRIEELASRDNFHTEEGQQELRDLIADAVRGVGGDERKVRRRVD